MASHVSSEFYNLKRKTKYEEEKIILASHVSSEFDKRISRAASRAHALDLAANSIGKEKCCRCF